MFKEKKMRKVVENHLYIVETLLVHAKKHDLLQETIDNYTSQKLALEYVLQEFDRMGV